MSAPSPGVRTVEESYKDPRRNGDITSGAERQTLGAPGREPVTVPEGNPFERKSMMLRMMGLMAFGLLAGCSSERAFGAYNWSDHTWSTPNGLKVEDRVSRKLIDPKTAIRLEYRGEIYYFENAFDVEMFKMDPGVYFYHGYEPLYAGGP
jgi:YHS domain-containing protein